MPGVSNANRRSHTSLRRSHFLSNYRFNGTHFRPRSRKRTAPNRSGNNRKAIVQNETRSVMKHDPIVVHWLPSDDYLLINSVIMTCNLSEVHQTVRFSTFYTEKEIESRWRSLLFDSVVSSTSLSAIRNIPPLFKAQLDREVPFSAAEDNLISQVPFSDVFPDGILKSLKPIDLHNLIFTKLLQWHRSVFYMGRDEMDLFRQWSRFHDCHIVSNSSRTTGETLLNSDFNTTGCSLFNSTGFISPRTSLLDLNVNQASPSAPGGDPTSFSDTELLLEETVTSTLASGLEKLNEPSAVARRHRMLDQASYPGFQAQVTESVLAALSEEHSSGSSFNPVSPHQPCVSDLLPPPPLSAPPTHSGTILTTSKVIPSSRILTGGGGLSGRSLGRTIGQSNSIKGSNCDNRLTGIVNLPPQRTSDSDLQRRLEFYRRRRRLWAQLRRKSVEANRWTRLAQSATQVRDLIDPEPTYPALAALTGTRIRFLIKEKEVTFGRSSFAYRPHIDLSREGNTARVSRCHGRIRLSPKGTFLLANFSRHAVYVDGNPILTDEEVELCDLATVIVAHMKFRFDVNRELIHRLRSSPPPDVPPIDLTTSAAKTSLH